MSAQIRPVAQLPSYFVYAYESRKSSHSVLFSSVIRKRKRQAMQDKME